MRRTNVECQQETGPSNTSECSCGDLQNNFEPLQGKDKRLWQMFVEEHHAAREREG